SREAEMIFDDPDTPPALWFTPGNHEDYSALACLSHGGTATDFPVDAYLRVRCVRDGKPTTLPGGLRVGVLWGIDDQAPRARRNQPPEARIKPCSASQLAGETFDVLLTHDSPLDAMIPGSGSAEITALVDLARPAFLFFGHYKGPGRL